MWSIVSYPDKLWYNSQFKITITDANPAPNKFYRIRDLTYPNGEWDGFLGLYYANETGGPIDSSTYTIVWRVRFPNPTNKEGEQREYGPRQFEVFGDGVGPGATSQIITVTVSPDPEVFFPSNVLFNTEFSIEVSGAIPGEQYSIQDFSVDFNNRVLASGIAPSSSFTIFCSPLKSFTGPHEIRAFFYSQPTEQLSPITSWDQEIAEPFVKTFYINAYTTTWNATARPGQIGRFFESNKRYQYWVGRSGVQVDFRLPLPQTITANIADLQFPTERILFLGTRVTFRDSFNGNRFFSGTISSRTVTSPFNVGITVNVDQVRNLRGEITSGNNWIVDQDPIIAGEIASASPILIQDELGPATRNDLTYTQIDLGQGLLPSYLSLDSATGFINGTIPSNEKMAGYTIGIEITDGFKTEVVAWYFGGIVGAVEIDPGVFDYTLDVVLRYPIRSSLPNGVIRVDNIGLVPPNIGQFVWADGKDLLDGNGNGVIEVGFLDPPRGRYRIFYTLYAIDGPLSGPEAVYGQFFQIDWTAPITPDGIISWEGVFVEDRTTYKVPSSIPIVITTVTNSITLRLGQAITPTAIISATGGQNPLRYVLGPIGDGFHPGGYLPSGLSFNTSTGILSGTPTSLYGKTNAPGLGGDTFWVNVTDGIKDANEVGATFFTIGGFVSNFTATTVLTTTTVIVGVSVSLTPVVASNAIGATTFSVSPSIPAGLVFNTSSGQITGTASSTSSLTAYIVTVNDSGGSVSTATFNLRVETSNLATTLNVPSVTLSSGTGITPFIPVTYTGGYGSVSYSVTPNLPNNLILNTVNGQISGIPISPQSATSYTIRVRDEANQVSTQILSITITPSFFATVVEPELAFVRGVSIDPVRPVEATNGVSPYTYSVSPALPGGLSFNTSNGFITGTPVSSTTTTSRTVTITDSNSKVASGSFTIRVQPLVISPSSSTLVLASDYNDIRSLNDEILGTNILGYGYQGVKSVSTTSIGEIIGWEEWSNLKDDINLSIQHLTGSPFNYTTASVLTSQLVNQFIDSLNLVESIRYNRPNQVATGTTSSVWTSTYVSTWGSSIDTTATLSWAQGLDINYFFNLGGAIEFELGYLPSGSTTNNLGWQTLIDQSQDMVDNFVYNRESYLGFTTVSTSTTSTTGSVVLSVTKNANTLTCSIQLTNNLLTGTVDLQVLGEIKYVYSDTILPAPLPREIDLKEFTTGTFTPVFTPVKALRLTAPTNSYSWNLPSSSNVETITIQNVGNQPVSVSSITFNDNANVDRIVNGTINGSIGAFIVNTTSNYTFTLAYTGTVLGSYNSQFTVNAESPVGNITTSTRQLIGPQPFSITVSPPSVNDSSNGLGTWQQSFVINSINGDGFSYTSTLLSEIKPSGSIGWSKNDSNQSVGPILSFSPIGATVGTFTASVTLRIAATSAVTGSVSTVDVLVTLALTIPASAHLGDWVSPLAANNAVIGMSYDLIDGERWLTIGVGMGADGSVPLNVGGIGSVDVNNLGINADPDFKQGQRLYPVLAANQASDWSPFLKALGSWPNSIPEQPYNINVGFTPSYRFYAPATGNYSYEFSVDDDGSFYLLPADEYGESTGSAIFLTPSLMTGGASSNWRQSYTGTINLTAGWYIFRYWHSNYAKTGAAAFQIKDPSGNIIWNTRYPVRTSPNYLYWQDVIRIRIPANGTAKNLFSSSWYVKNTYQVSNKAHWGYYFNPDMFKVIDDGAGNLTISLFGTPRAPIATDPNAANDKLTIKSLSAAFYYYLPPSVLTRYNNLDAGPVGDGNQTRYFSGFNASGNVLTVLQTIPTSIPEPIPTSTGDGGGGQFDFEEFQNQQLK